MINNTVDFLYECDAVIETKLRKHMILPKKCNTASVH